MFKTFVCLYDLLREKLNCCCDRKIKSSFLSVKLRCIKSIWTINIRFFVSCWSQFIFPDRYKWVQKRLHVFMSNWFHGFHHISMYLTLLEETRGNIRYYIWILMIRILNIYLLTICAYTNIWTKIYIFLISFIVTIQCLLTWHFLFCWLFEMIYDVCDREILTICRVKVPPFCLQYFHSLNDTLEINKFYVSRIKSLIWLWIGL